MISYDKRVGYEVGVICAVVNACVGKWMDRSSPNPSFDDDDDDDDDVVDDDDDWIIQEDKIRRAIL